MQRSASARHAARLRIVLGITAAILDRLGGCLSGDFDIEHSTFQLEPSDRRPVEEATHR